MASNIFFKNKEGEYSIFTINNRDTKLRELDSITTKEDAYFIGYLLGDGGLSKGGDKRVPRMSVTSKDKYIVEYFRDRYQPDSNIKSRIPVNDSRPSIVSTEESHRVGFSSYYSDFFNECGILTTKPYRVIKNIPDEFMKYYILGLLDSDGSISYHIQESNSRFRAGIKFTHPSIDMLGQLTSFFKREPNINTSICKKKGENCYALSIAGLYDVIKFLDWIYSDLPEMYNKRKYENSLSLRRDFERLYFSVKDKVVGVRMYNRVGGIVYNPFIVLNNNHISLGNFKSHDEAVKVRLCKVAECLDDIGINRWNYYNPTSNTFKLTYLSHDDNKQTYLEVSLDGTILQFNKL